MQMFCRRDTPEYSVGPPIRISKTRILLDVHERKHYFMIKMNAIVRM